MHVAKDPTSLVEVERQLQLLKKANVSKTRFLIIGAIAIVLGAPVAIANAFTGDIALMVIGLIFLVAGILNVTAAFTRPASVARRIEYLEILAIEMEEESAVNPESSQADDNAKVASQTRTCPFCAETIQGAAIVCRYCGRDLPRSDGWSATTREQARYELHSPSNPENGFGTTALIAGLVGLFLPIPFVAPAVALVFGLIGDYKVKTMRATNKAMAVAGVWLGLLGTVAWMIIVFYFFLL